MVWKSSPMKALKAPGNSAYSLPIQLSFIAFLNSSVETSPSWNDWHSFSQANTPHSIYNRNGKMMFELVGQVNETLPYWSLPNLRFHSIGWPWSPGSSWRHFHTTCPEKRKPSKIVNEEIKLYVGFWKLLMGRKLWAFVYHFEFF